MRTSPVRPASDHTTDALRAAALLAGLGVAACVQYVRHPRHATGYVGDRTLDQRARRWFLDRHHAGVRRALHVAGFAGNLPVYGAAAGWAAYRVAARRGPRHAAPVLGAVVGAIAAHAALKHAVGRVRPAGAEAAGNRKPSFPSGHTTRATAVAAVVGYTAVRDARAPRAVVVPLAIGIPFAVGVSRAYADQHWLSDVVGGWALGGTVAALCALWSEASYDASDPAEPRPARPSRAIAPGATSTSSTPSTSHPSRRPRGH